MADHDLLLRREIEALRDLSPPARAAVYGRARRSLSIDDRSIEVGTDVLTLKQHALEEAIARVEAECAADLTLDENRGASPLSPTASPQGSDVALVPAESAEPPIGNSRRRLAVNAAAGGVANMVKVVIQLVMLPVMAHLLGPAEFGLYALALPTVSFFLVLADGGLGVSLARERESASVVWSTAFWVLLATGVILAAVVAGWGEVLSVLAAEPRLAGIMAFLSISFLLITLSVLPAARLTRRGNLVVFSAADATATLVGAIVAVVLAASGAGAWSLAVQYVVGFLIRAIILNAAAFVRPTREFRLSTLRQHISTGSSVLGSRLAEFASRLVENLVFGRTFGAASLGAYTFANQAPRFLCEAAGNPVWAALYAQALHEDPRRVALLHARLIRLLASVLFPATMMLAASAPQLLNLILGPKWAPAAILLQILVPSYAISTIATQSAAILLANGRNAVTFWMVVGASLGRVAAVSLGLWTGPTGVACGVVLSNLLYAVGMFAAPSKTTGAGVWTLVEGMIPPALASAMAGLACFVVINLRHAGVVWIGTSLALGAVIYLAAMLLLDGGRIRTDIATLRRMALRRPAEAV